MFWKYESKTFLRMSSAQKLAWHGNWKFYFRFDYCRLSHCGCEDITIGPFDDSFVF